MVTPKAEKLKSAEQRRNVRGEVKTSGLQILVRRYKLFRLMWADKTYKANKMDYIKIGACLFYAVCPIDFIPDFILGFGQIDDLMILVLAYRIFIGMLDQYEAYLQNKQNPTYTTFEKVNR